MKVILGASENIVGIWNRGKPAAGVWRLMSYTLQTDCKDGTLLYNVVTGELLLLTDAETEELSSLPCSYAPWMDSLIEKRFLVPEEAEEAETVNRLRAILRMVERTGFLTGYTILPTTACNARCFYCYENGTPCVTMSEETVQQTVQFIKSRHGDLPVRLNWFGGEPTLGIKQIDQICTELRDAGIEYTSSMISNGYLMTETVVKRAKEDWKLTEIQITLDGTEEVYNRTKAYVGVSGSPYRQVLDNIGHLLDAKIRVSIRLNLGSHNAEDLEDLVRELASRYENKELLSVCAAFLFEDCCGAPLPHEKAETDRLLNRQKALTEQIRKHGLSKNRSSLPVLCTYACMADNDCSVIILPDGKLGKCDRRLNSLIIGNLAEGIADREQLQACRRTVSAPECSGCFLYPGCIRLAICGDGKAGCSEDRIKKERDRVSALLKERYLFSQNRTPVLKFYRKVRWMNKMKQFNDAELEVVRMSTEVLCGSPPCHAIGCTAKCQADCCDCKAQCGSKGPQVQSPTVPAED